MLIDIRIFLKGMAMGAADVVPGVSGGTVAFISGIYEQLLESIRRINPTLIGHIRQQGFASAWQHINGTFLTTLFAGVATSFISLAKLITYLLVHQPIPVWSFFFGLIVISIVHISRQIGDWRWPNMSGALCGFLLAYVITIAHPLALEPTLVNVLLGGMIAICAMILPGISGSFILLLLGLYLPIIEAVKGFDATIIGVFLCGAVLGLLTFSHLLSFLLKRYHGQTLAFLTGLMVGTLPEIWPWKQTLTTRMNSSGEQVPLTEQVLTPWQYAELTGQNPQVVSAIICVFIGIGLVWGLERFAAQSH
ncbi:MAG: DUF368 domain-containing protein [Ferrimonas sp.]